MTNSFRLTNQKYIFLMGTVVGYDLVKKRALSTFQKYVVYILFILKDKKYIATSLLETGHSSKTIEKYSKLFSFLCIVSTFLGRSLHIYVFSTPSHILFCNKIFYSLLRFINFVHFFLRYYENFKFR